MEQLLVTNCLTFFSNPKNMTKMYDIVVRKEPMSLRMLDHAIVNWSRENDIYFWQEGKEHNKFFDIHNSYKNMLCHYTKKYFDPFRRHCHLTVQLKDSVTGLTEEFATTVGQLSFFKWLIEEDIVIFIEAHLAEIKSWMERDHPKKAKQEKKRAKAANHHHSISFLIDGPKKIHT